MTDVKRAKNVYVLSRFLLVVLLLSIISACAERAPVTSTTQKPLVAVFQCGDMYVEPEFVQDRLHLTLDGTTHRLEHVPSASGAKYVTGSDDNRIVFWNKGDNARLELLGEVYPECRKRKSVTNPVEEVLPFKARGNEPGWFLTITEDSMELVSNYGMDKISVPRPVPTVTGSGYRYTASTEGHTIVVTIEDHVCRDTMSGMPYPKGVLVRIDGQELAGCGGDPASLLMSGEWIVEDIANRGIISSSRVTLNFGADGNLSGYATCNQYTGSYALTGETLTIGIVALTKRACPPALMSQEARFTTLLRGIQAFDLSRNGELILKTRQSGTIRARRQDPY